MGDAILGLVIAGILYKHYPAASEGDLSRLRAHLVCKKTLADLAKNIQLSDVLKLGAGERKTGGHYRSSILANSLEAVFGALYLLKGFEFTAGFIAGLYEKSLAMLPEADALKDPKTRLQEYLQSRRMDVPRYMLMDEQGKDNNKSFRVECRVETLGLISHGEEKSKKKAEQLAARHMLDCLRAR